MPHHPLCAGLFQERVGFDTFTEFDREPRRMFHGDGDAMSFSHGPYSMQLGKVQCALASSQVTLFLS